MLLNTTMMQQKTAILKIHEWLLEKKLKRPHRARRPPDRLNVLTGNLVDTTSVAIVETEEPTAIEEALSFVNCMLW